MADDATLAFDSAGPPLNDPAPVVDFVRSLGRQLPRTAAPEGWVKRIVPYFYRDPAFEVFDDFSDFLESVSCETSKSCQVRGSGLCRGSTPLDSVA